MTDRGPVDLPLFEAATRRAVLRRGLALGGALLAAPVIAACAGYNDREVFASGTGTPPSTTGAANPSTTNPTTTRTPPTTTTKASAGTPSTTSTTSMPSSSSAPVTLSFTYTAAAAGRVNNPYVAAWVEDAGSTLVAVIAVIYVAREAKYLRELTSWAAVQADADPSQIDAVTGPTRRAGAYTFHWDGKGLDGKPLQGQHTLWIEAAREHGPRSVTSGPVRLATPGTTSIPANGELSNVVMIVG